MRLISILNIVLFSLLITIVPVKAGDFATRDILGFSADGTRFAFEEFGIQDGSGFPYSTIYLIDTQSDNWVGGSPFRARIDNETASIDDARNLARDMAGNTLAAINRDGVINATNQPLEVIDNPHRMEARPFPFNPPTGERIEFRLEEIDFFDEGLCKDLGGASGFRLVQIFRNPGGSTRLLHEDTAVPKSRGCPQNYRFADIVTYRPEAGNELIIAVLVLYEAFGFEGPDGRYLAVTTKMPVQ